MYRVRRELLIPDEEELGEGVRVAVLDTGIDPHHPDLAGRIELVGSRSFALVDELTDRNGHGTHVAGIICGTGAASNGVFRGVAPLATILVYKICGGIQGYELDAAAAIEAAISAKADIINYSHGFSPPMHQPPPWVWSDELNFLEEAFVRAEERGILCVVAAGNKGPLPSSITRPGGLESALTIGALGLDNDVYLTSGRGPYLRSETVRAGGWARCDSPFHDNATRIRKPDFVLPGESITSLRSSSSPMPEGDPDDQLAHGDFGDPRYVAMSGTSEATAVASGLAAALLGLARSHGVDLGQNAGRTIRRLMLAGAAAGRLTSGSLYDVGRGTIVWPTLKAALRDFVGDAHFRQRILEGVDLRLVL